MELSMLDKLIPQYAENKLQLDNYKKICDKENTAIKSIMIDSKLDKREAGGYKATVSVSTRESLDEDILVSLFSSVPAFVAVDNKFEIIKSKPYIDFDALENAIYGGALTADQLAELDKAKEVKEVVTLRVSKIKKKEEKECI